MEHEPHPATTDGTAPDVGPETSTDGERSLKWRPYFRKLEAALTELGYPSELSEPERAELIAQLGYISTPGKGGASVKAEAREVRKIEAELAVITETVFRNAPTAGSEQEQSFLQRFDETAAAQFCQNVAQATRRLFRHQRHGLTETDGHPVLKLTEMPPAVRAEVYRMILPSALELGQNQADRYMRSLHQRPQRGEGRAGGGKPALVTQPLRGRLNRANLTVAPGRDQRGFTESTPERRMTKEQARLEATLELLRPTEQAVMRARLQDDPLSIPEQAAEWGISTEKCRRIVDFVTAKFNRLLDGQAGQPSGK